jgi:hypothetical protein
MVIKYTKWQKHRPNGRKIYQHLSLQDALKVSYVEILVWKCTIWQPSPQVSFTWPETTGCQYFDVWNRFAAQEMPIFTRVMYSQLCWTFVPAFQSVLSTIVKEKRLIKK